MAHTEVFTDTMYYRRLASMLHKQGHTQVPSPILRYVRSKDHSFTKWLSSAKDTDNFQSLIEHYLDDLINTT